MLRHVGRRTHPETSRQISYWFCKPLSSAIAIQDTGEIAEARWVTIEEAFRLLGDRFSEPARIFKVARLSDGFVSGAYSVRIESPLCPTVEPQGPAPTYVTATTASFSDLLSGKVEGGIQSLLEWWLFRLTGPSHDTLRP